MSAPRTAERRVQVRWSDGDPLGHVNNSLFFTYLEIARAGLIEEALGPEAWGDCILARVELDFRAEIPISCREVTVRCHVLRLGTSSVRTLDEIVLPDGTVAGRAESVLVVRDMAVGKSRPLTDGERDRLTAFLAPVDPKA